MTSNDIRLVLNPGVELERTNTPGVARAVIVDATRTAELTWDRFARLSRTAEAIKQRIPKGLRILDIGGFDGALALFLPNHQVDVIDPITTGGTGLELKSIDSYPVIVSIDALEHIEPERRELFLDGTMKLSEQHYFINFPARRSTPAQRLVYELTDNPLVREHVMWLLPCSDEIVSYMETRGFTADVIEHTSTAQWVSQYMLQSVAQEIASATNSYLWQQHKDDPAGVPLYDLLIGERL